VTDLCRSIVHNSVVSKEVGCGLQKNANNQRDTLKNK
jgi:hypothetical protein